jgi:hypothetical protein
MIEDDRGRARSYIYMVFIAPQYDSCRIMALATCKDMRFKTVHQQDKARRILALITCLILGLVAGCVKELKHSAATPVKQAASRPPIQLTSAQLTRLRRALAPLDVQYDPAEQMLREPFSSPGYHTTLTGGFVHSTRSSLNYAVALLDTRDDALLPRAEAILRKVISLQDQNPTNTTCGIWPWFLEEPLAKMSPPDWNWADFCGVALLQVALDHRDRLSPALAARLDAAIQCAARSIQHRNVGSGYTNIAIMGTYVTLIVAEFYHLNDLREYALARLRRFYDYTLENGSFTEYNSPTYTLVALKELARLRQDTEIPEAREMADKLYRLAWEDIAQHFYAPARQWAGPHSRCYQTLLGRGTLALIQRSMDGRVSFGRNPPNLDEARLPTPCARELEHYFTTLDAPRELRETFLKGEKPLIGTTHLESAFALGSINRGNFWEQCRPLVAYWGTADEPSYFRVRVMHDGHDFSDAQFFSVQRGGDVLAAINFAIDGGDKHPSLDRIKNATITATNLCVRFEFGGAAGKSELKAPASLSEPAQIHFGNLRFEIAVPSAMFENFSARWESGSDGANSWLDVVLYSGERKRFNFAELNAVAGMAIRLATSEDGSPKVSAEIRDGVLHMNWQSLRLELPARPGKTELLQKSFTASGAE